MLKRILVVLCLLLISMSRVHAVEFQGKAYIVMDSLNRIVLSSHNQNHVQSVASISKIMTCIIAIEEGNLNDVYELKNDMNEIVKLNQLEVTEVVMSRMTEILEFAKKQIFLLTKKDIQYIILTGGLTEIKSFKNLVYEILGKDVIIYSMDEIGIRDNKYTTVMGMVKYLDAKMTIRGRDYSMISQEEEELLLTPDEKKRKEKVVVSKIFKGFIRNKEEKL